MLEGAATVVALIHKLLYCAGSEGRGTVVMVPPTHGLVPGAQACGVAAHTRSVPLRQRSGHYHGGDPILAFMGVRQACGSKVVAVCHTARPAQAARGNHTECRGDMDQTCSHSNWRRRYSSPKSDASELTKL